MVFDKNNLIFLIEQKIKEALDEFKYRDTITPDNSKTVRDINLGYNPLSADNGGHASNDVVRQASTFDYNGETFETENRFFFNRNKFTMYKIKNFGTDSITCTMSLFGKGANGEKSLRTAIDLLNGGATRNGRFVNYRTITLDSSAEKAEKSGWMIDTFWEFTLDYGKNWYILKPKPLENIKQSKLK